VTIARALDANRSAYDAFLIVHGAPRPPLLLLLLSSSPRPLRTL